MGINKNIWICSGHLIVGTLKNSEFWDQLFRLDDLMTIFPRFFKETLQINLSLVHIDIIFVYLWNVENIVNKNFKKLSRTFHLLQ